MKQIKTIMLALMISIALAAPALAGAQDASSYVSLKIWDVTFDYDYEEGNYGGELYYQAADSTYTVIEFSQRLSEAFELVGAVNYDADAQEVRSVMGAFGFRDYTVRIEKAELEGKITVNGVEVDTFKNDYSLYAFYSTSRQIRRGYDFNYGFAYFDYDRPAKITVGTGGWETIEFFDPSTNVRGAGLYIGIDPISGEYNRDGNNGAGGRPYWALNAILGWAEVQLSPGAAKQYGINETWSGISSLMDLEAGYLISARRNSGMLVFNAGYQFRQSGVLWSSGVDEELNLGEVAPPAVDEIAYGPYVRLSIFF